MGSDLAASSAPWQEKEGQRLEEQYEDEKKHVGSNCLSSPAADGEYEEEEWPCCFPGLLVVKADLKTNGWSLTSLAGIVVVVVVVVGGCCCYSFVSTLPKFL
jgi:hypothetical protein